MATKTKNELATRKKDASVPANIPRSRSVDQAQNLRSKLISAIAELHSEVESINVFSEMRQWKIGCYLFALKGLSGHGNFKANFDATVGHVMSFRQAQRYMAKKKEVDSYIPVLRERLIGLKPQTNIESISDEDVLKSTPAEDLRTTLTTKKTRANSAIPLLPPMPHSLSSEFTDALASVFKRFNCLLSTEPLEVDSSLVEELRVGADPLSGITVFPQSMVAISGLGKQSSKWIAELLPAAASARGSETVVVIPLKHLSNSYQLFDFPNLLVASDRLFTLPTKQIPSHFIVSFIARPERSREFAESFVKLGTVKLPVAF